MEVTVPDPLPSWGVQGPAGLFSKTSFTISAGDLNIKGGSGDADVLQAFLLLGGLYTPLGKQTLGSTLERSGEG